jgi:PAS domain S-box-containing protein
MEVYEANLAAATEATMQAALEDPSLEPLVRAMTPEQRELQNQQSRERLNRAVQSGDWDEYQQALLGQGMLYARQGMSFAAWHQIARAWTKVMVPLLVEAYASQPQRLTGALQSMDHFLGKAMAIIGESYIATKEAELRQSEQRLAITLHSIGDAVIATDAQGRIERMNAVAEQLTGWRTEDVVGKPLPEVFRIENEYTGDPVEDPVARVLREGIVVGLANHTALVRRDETRIPIADSAAPIRDAHGVIQGVVLVFRDISHQQEQDAALQMSEQRKAAVLESSLDPIVTMDHEGRVLDFNPAAVRIFGYTVEQALGRPLAELVIPEPQRAAHATTLQQVTGRRAELPAQRADGTEFPAEVALTRVREVDPPLYVGFIRDLTESKQAEAAKSRAHDLELQNSRIREASRMKSEFLANMSHELRTPLNSIIGFAELLYDGEVGPTLPRQQEFLGDILSSGRHLLQLINDVLDLAKVEAGKMEFHPERISLETVVSEVASILRHTAASKRIRIESDLQIAEVVLDAGRLKQVLYNYLSNALKFTPEGGRVIVRARPEQNDMFALEVEDTGIGIAPDDLGRLFIEFQQLDAGAAKKHGGTGLGLALTRRLVEAQGGLVTVRSHPGQGSVFGAVLPLQAREAPPPAMPRPEQQKATGPRILVVEDDARDQAVVCEALLAAGCRVQIAQTGTQALASCREQQFDAITLDLLLPDMTGLQFLSSLREDSRYERVPIVVVTVVTESATAGFIVHDVLRKPIDTQQITASLRRAGVLPGHSSSVVVVDDDGGSLRLMGATLTNLGFQPVCFQDPKEAIERLAGRGEGEPVRPDAVILDLLMPEMDGFQFLDAFRAETEHRDVPVLVWTMKDLTSEEHERLKRSAQAVIRKGGGTSELLGALKSWLESGHGR